MPKDLLLYNILDKRMNLSSEQKQYYWNLKKGYEGELLFDSFTKKLDGHCTIINDLLLKVKNATFQIDSLILSSKKVYLYEIKNVAGDYYFESDRFFKRPKLEINNPIHQLSRSESLFRQLLLEIGLQLPIESYVVFINPQFTLYQAPLDNRLIFPTQINRHIDHLKSLSSPLNEKHNRLAKELLSRHITDSPYTQIPTYDYKNLKKGIYCFKCGSFSVEVVKMTCICKQCGFKELMKLNVMRMVKEFILLFPEQKITTNVIHDWVKIINSKRSIRRILANNFKAIGTKQWTYYEPY